MTKRRRLESIDLTLRQGGKIAAVLVLDDGSTVRLKPKALEALVLGTIDAAEAADAMAERSTAPLN